MTDTNPSTSALVVIDVQNAVMESAAWDPDGVVSRIATLIQRARDEGVPVVYVQHEEEGGMDPGSPGWQIVEDIAPRDGEPVVAKRYGDSFAETTLQDTLHDLGARHLVICGAQTDFCIRTSTQRALIEGYDVTLVEDCHTTEDAIFDMTDGEKVSISAKQIVAHQNRYFYGISYPGVSANITPHNEVDFSR
jgi:nicotinamidase-related amidase